MTKEQLKHTANVLAELQGERMRLGGFDANASAILTLTSTLLSIVEHLQIEANKEKK
jgi:hypothetical protein